MRYSDTDRPDIDESYSVTDGLDIEDAVLSHRQNLTLRKRYSVTDVI